MTLPLFATFQNRPVVEMSGSPARPARVARPPGDVKISCMEALKRAAEKDRWRYTPQPDEFEDFWRAFLEAPNYQDPNHFLGDLFLPPGKAQPRTPKYKWLLQRGAYYVSCIGLVVRDRRLSIRLVDCNYDCNYDLFRPLKSP